MGLPTPLARVLDAVQGAAPPRVHQAPAVRWLSVPQLVRTAVDVLQASSFAKYADKRETMATSPREFYRLPAADEEPRDAVFVDYVADTGDGFNATFATARVLSGTADGALAPDPEFATRGAQADLLVFGGDEVYPVASALQYEQRLNEVLRTAAILDKVVDPPPVMALPGNHDWYDGLASFRRNFCESWVQRDAPRGEDAHRGARRPTCATTSAAGARSSPAATSRCSCRRAGGCGPSTASSTPRSTPSSCPTSATPARTSATPRSSSARPTPSWLEAERAGTETYSAEADSPLYTLLWFIDRVLGPRRAPPDPARPDRRPAPLRPLHLHRADPAARHGARRPTSPSAPELVTCGGGGAFLASTHHLPRTPLDRAAAVAERLRRDRRGSSAPPPTPASRRPGRSAAPGSSPRRGATGLRSRR